MEMKRVGAAGVAALGLIVGLAGLAPAAQARVSNRVQMADLSCASQKDPQLYALGRAVEAGVSPVAVPIVNDLGGKRLRNADLAAFTVGEMPPGGRRADEVMRELARAAGRPLDVVGPRGMVFPVVDIPVKGMSLDKAVDVVAAASSLTWGFDGKVIRVAPRNEWSFALPKDRDLALAVIEAVRRFAPASVSVEGGALHLVGDEARATQVAGVISSVFAQPRINPFDVTWYKVWPARGEINWSGMPLRTEVVRDFAFAGRGVSMVLKDTSLAAVPRQHLWHRFEVVN